MPSSSSSDAGQDQVRALLEHQQKQRSKQAALAQARKQLLEKSKSGAKLMSAVTLAGKRAKRIKTVDLCFVFDATASMQTWLDIAAQKMQEIVNDAINRLGENAKVQVAFVGYRDYLDEERSIVMPFTTDIAKVKDFLEDIDATGGGDACEDVLTGLEEALQLKWTATTKVLFLLSQTPHHGYRFHQKLEVCTDFESLQASISGLSDLSDEDRSGVLQKMQIKFYDLYRDDPRQWEPMDLAMSQLQEKGIQLICLKVDDSTDKMFEVFRRTYASGPSSLQLMVCPIKSDPVAFRRVVSDSTSRSVSASICRMSQTSQIHTATAKDMMPIEMGDAEVAWEEWESWELVDVELVSYTVRDLDAKAQKRTTTCRVSIRKDAFSKGAMRFAFYLYQPDQQFKLVGKVYQTKDFQQRSTYEGDMETQAVSQCLAKEFGQYYQGQQLQFVQAQLMVLPDYSCFPFKYMSVEPYIPGSYEKFTSNNGFVKKDSELAQAFSHFSWCLTEGDMMVTDIQGVSNTLTDPQIHSDDVSRFGVGNLGTKGMDLFFMNHECNSICESMELQKNPIQLMTFPETSHQDRQSAYIQSGRDEERICSMPLIAEADELDEAQHSDHEPTTHFVHEATCRFLTQLRHDAAQASTCESLVDILAGASISWEEDLPKVVAVKPRSPADKVGLKVEACISHIGGKSLRGTCRAGVLKLLSASDDNLGFCWSPKHLEDMAKKFSSNVDLDLDSALETLDIPDFLQFLQSVLTDEKKDTKTELLKHLLELHELLESQQEGQKRPKFLAALRTAAAEALTNPAAGWDQDRQVATDTLAGACFAWQQPPCIIKVEPASLADGCLRIGEVLVQVDESDVGTMTRNDILRLLKDASEIRLHGSTSTSFSFHFEPETGLKIASVGNDVFRLCELPVTLKGRKKKKGDVLLRCDDQPLYKKSEQDVLQILGSHNQQILATSKMMKAYYSPLLRKQIKKQLTHDKIPIHPGVSCCCCRTSPLVGRRFKCQICQDINFCGSCFAGRGHSHPVDHNFTVQEGFWSQETSAPAAPSLNSGASAVVINTGTPADGKVGFLNSSAASSLAASSTWEVVLPDSCKPLNLQAENLFLLGSEAVQTDPNIKEQVVHSAPPVIESPAASPSAEHQAPPKSQEGESASEPVHAEVEPDCSPVQEVYSARGLRQSPSQDAWTKQGSFLCNGKCGNRVTMTHQAYSQAGQIVFCDLCRAKVNSTRMQITCEAPDCHRTVSYSRFLCQVQGCEVPTLCQSCQVNAGLGSWSLLDLTERLESSDKFGQ